MGKTLGKKQAKHLVSMLREAAGYASLKTACFNPGSRGAPVGWHIDRIKSLVNYLKTPGMLAILPGETCAYLEMLAKLLGEKP